MEYELPNYSMTWDGATEQEIKGDAPVANDLTAKVLSAMNPAPSIDAYPDTYVHLPAGYIFQSEVVQDAEVRELTGADEEALEKARVGGNPAKYINTLLQCGVVSVGSHTATQSILDELVQGDLDALLMGVRRATFGDDFEVFGVVCESCGESNDLSLNLKDIPVKELDDPSVRDFLVPLRKGRSARVQFPTGAVQTEIFKKNRTITEMNNLTLAACILAFVEADGSETPCNGINAVKKMGVSDRKTIQMFIYDNQPGPRYDQVVAQCHACEGEVPVPLSVGVLFREL